MAQAPLRAAAAPAAAAAAAPPPPAAAAAAAPPAQALAGPPGAGLARPVVVPPEFAGSSSDDWPTFLARFNAACTVNGYGNAARLQFLPCCLKDTAFTSFQAITQAQPNLPYAQICQELEQRFNPPQQAVLLEAEFRARRKQVTESQVEFSSALQRLAARAFPGQQGPLFERLVLNQFIDGQDSPQLRLHIRTASPATLDAAVRRALEVAAIFDVETRRTQPSATLACGAQSDFEAATSHPLARAAISPVSEGARLTSSARVLLAMR